jgi:hypothetical protein
VILYDSCGNEYGDDDGLMVDPFHYPSVCHICGTRINAESEEYAVN